MNDLKRKLKRTDPLIKVRKSQLDKEAAELASIRKEKLACLERLRCFQNQYMQGIEMLNVERQSCARDQLSTLERGVDTAKSRWYESLKDLRVLESQEKAQTAQLIVAERNLKSVEKLKERYDRATNQKQLLADQAVQDEISIRKYSQG